MQMSEKRFVFYLWPQDFWKCSLVKTGGDLDKKVLSCVLCAWGLDVFTRFLSWLIWFCLALNSFYVLFTNNISMITKHSTLKTHTESFLKSPMTNLTCCYDSGNLRKTSEIIIRYLCRFGFSWWWLHNMYPTPVWGWHMPVSSLGSVTGEVSKVMMSLGRQYKTEVGECRWPNLCTIRYEQTAACAEICRLVSARPCVMGQSVCGARRGNMVLVMMWCDQIMLPIHAISWTQFSCVSLTQWSDWLIFWILIFIHVTFYSWE